MLQIVSQLALTCKDQSITEKWYAENFGFKRARVAKLPDGNEIIFLKMALQTMSVLPHVCGLTPLAQAGRPL